MHPMHAAKNTLLYRPLYLRTDGYNPPVLSRTRQNTMKTAETCICRLDGNITAENGGPYNVQKTDCKLHIPFLRHACHMITCSK